MQSDLTRYGQLAQAYVIDPDMERARMVEAMMRDHLSREQMHELRDVLEAVFSPQDGAQADNGRYIDMFIEAKRVENLSARTLKYYETTLRKCVDYMGKPLRFVDANDVRRCLAWAMTERNCTPTTVNNERRILSTFFQWLENEDIIRKSPVKRTKALKEEKADKKPFSDEEVAKLREACCDERERAVFELLLSSGMRVSELCGLDIGDVDMQGRECEVLGKAAVERMTRDMGRRAEVANVHPHRFRRTMATNNLRRGMKLEEIQQLLGHANMDTTLIYARVDKEMLKVNARRLA